MIDSNLMSLLAVTFIVIITVGIREVFFPRPKSKNRKPQLPWGMISPRTGICPFEGQSVSVFKIDIPDVHQSVAEQSKQPGDIVLWTGDTKDEGFENFKAFIDEACQYAGIRYVHVYKEMFWENPGFLALGARESQIASAANYAKVKGLEPIISLMPDVILNPDFSLKRINVYSAILIIDYPSINPTIRLNDMVVACSYSKNLTTNLLYLSVQKLRALGFVGEVWYIFQAFGLSTLTSDVLTRDFLQQCETIEDAKNIGVTLVIPYGLYLGDSDLEANPALFQGKGTIYEALIRRSLA